MSIEAARTADFDFCQWFARVVFPCNSFDPFHTILEVLILSSNVPPVISSVLIQILLVH